VRDDGGKPVRSAEAVAPGMRLDIEFGDGHVGAVAESGTAKPAPPPRRRRKRADDEQQGDFFHSKSAIGGD
jgi:exodeoxyribonuclease VII large subunit